MATQTTVQLPTDLTDEAEAVTRVQRTSINQLIVASLRAETDWIRADDDLASRAQRLPKRDWARLERLVRRPGHLPRPESLWSSPVASWAEFGILAGRAEPGIRRREGCGIPLALTRFLVNPLW